MGQQFNGSTNGMMNAHASSGYPLSASFRVMFHTITNNMSPIAFSNSVGPALPAYMLVQNKAGGNRLLSVSAGGGYLTYNSTAAGIVTTGVWYHIALTFTSANGNAFHWLDNVEIDTSEGTPAASGNYDTTSIGAIHFNGAFQNFCHCTIAELAIFDFAFTSPIVDELFKGCPIRIKRPVDYWPLAGGVLGGLCGRVFTNTGSASVADHPRVFR